MYTEALTPTLVVIVNNRRDWQRVIEERWYRIPALHAPALLAAAYLAFYQTRVFGDDAWQIGWIAPVHGYCLLRRIDLLPHESSHPRAGNWYYRVDLGAPERLVRPLPSRRLRRITFIPTTLEALQAADDVSDLWQVDDLTPLVWTLFHDAAIKATRRLEWDGCDLP
jgi:hypothetical protein